MSSRIGTRTRQGFRSALAMGLAALGMAMQGVSAGWRGPRQTRQLVTRGGASRSHRSRFAPAHIRHGARPRVADARD